VNLALKQLGCSQKDLAEKLGVSAGQLSKWKNYGDYMSHEVEKKINTICHIGELPAEFVLRFGSVENATKWDKFLEQIVQYSLEVCESSYPAFYLEDYHHNNISSNICEILEALSVDLPLEAPFIDDDVVFEEPYVKVIGAIFEAYTGINDFFYAYFQELGTAESTDEVMMEMEVNFLNLAACKATFDPRFAPNLSSFRGKWLRYFKDKILEIKYKAVQSHEPLREELMNLVKEPTEKLLEDAEREALGLNADQIHPDIYTNEILLSVRAINKILPRLVEKLELDLEQK
jgi:transcriptional regulator with XRE-family HTH domain